MSTTATPTQQPAADARGTGLGRLSWPLALTGSILMIAGSLMSWSYNPRVLGDLTLYFNPGALQIQMILVGLLGLVFTLSVRGPLRKLGRFLDAGRALQRLGLGAAAFMALVLVAITLEAGGLINADPGAWVVLLGAVLAAVGGHFSTHRPDRDITGVRLPAWAEILLIVAGVGAFLFLAADALSLRDPWQFVLLLGTVGILCAALAGARFFDWLGIVASRHSRVLMLAAFVAAFAFPLTQQGSDANMSIATQVIIFAATAIGLNIVVGLAGLLDLGYIAFLGSGAYVGAILSGSAFSTIGWTPPFFVTVLIAGVFTAILGLIIGSPTLRVSGDYLAIVTLAFGEIFRYAMFNLDGNNGPNLTNGPNGIPAIPDLNFFGFDFGKSHDLFGFTITRFSNYYILLLIVLAFIILVFVRLNDSRIGRGWVAIREDEKAADAMGVNTFALKLFAFAGGAFLAGIAGSIKAHQDVSVTPDQYQFLESAFLLSAVVLGGMGTVGGVLIGAVILKLLPEKLRFFSEYRLLLFGLLLVLMMRFRPEGLVASKRRKLEFHEEDEQLAADIQKVHLREQQ
ncbi:branched-chain amino acid transport system permease protein [Kineosphaera limosa]|uniref:Branched-chain amino acid ABC transporter permease protein n=1 Tax=Kineosphaera limosa NBRC 100340 TaxID=1184609 RepID=K6WQS3_9MICO|nr:branched-chain amino acid ABC transporter permease [Kineosphaera limosa]NYE03120.1 branched-chain amino acid transport system permease protein [Kineosphaera limosa]GAB94457.1 branched-chain amino acid ABC transporter permease protein [Kineosphaera limosa NBRC 100340]